ncbi:hypothetical protein GDO81_028698 [Engystomops pustulosus]|uniref:Secreted protein n=1 Tax=Engystomops pustulosus TaxID=76066 RepID=A0AAV6YDU6_ENGPU|nr:hypothetical protein GDO81_028698 [Engystomops pustulosus]
MDRRCGAYGWTLHPLRVFLVIVCGRNQCGEYVFRNKVTVQLKPFSTNISPSLAVIQRWTWTSSTVQHKDLILQKENSSL